MANLGHIVMLTYSMVIKYHLQTLGSSNIDSQHMFYMFFSKKRLIIQVSIVSPDFMFDLPQLNNHLIINHQMNHQLNHQMNRQLNHEFNHQFNSLTDNKQLFNYDPLTITNSQWSVY